MPYANREDANAYFRKRYADKKYDWKQYNANTSEKRNALIESFKTPCVLCGYDILEAIEFHHTRDKLGDVGTMRRNGWGVQRITDELQKCVCLCRNCHKLVHLGLRSVSDR